MNEQTATMTRGGQVTVPSEVREMLGLREGDPVVFAWDGGVVTLSRHTRGRAPIRGEDGTNTPSATEVLARDTAAHLAAVEASFGAVRPLDRSLTVEEMTEIAAEEHAEEAMRG